MVNLSIIILQIACTMLLQNASACHHQAEALLTLALDRCPATYWESDDIKADIASGASKYFLPVAHVGNDAFKGFADILIGTVF